LGARLQYAKVIDRELYYSKGGRVHPGLENKVWLHDEPGIANAFLVLRAWTNDHGTVTERWRIESPGGRVVFESTPHEVRMPTYHHVEKLETEVSDLKLDFASDEYEIVFFLDEHEVARVTFPINPPDEEEGELGA
jgi:hypothetical protein